MKKKNDSSDYSFDFNLDSDAEFLNSNESFFSKPKINKNVTFLIIAAIMTFLFLCGLASVLYLAFNRYEFVNPNAGAQVATYDSKVLVFPEGTDDWKLGYSGGYPFFYCEMNGEWRKCFPIEVEKK